MDVKVCDRCGRPVDGPRKYSPAWRGATVTLETATGYRPEDYVGAMSWDLCGDCKASFIGWLGGGK